MLHYMLYTIEMPHTHMQYDRMNEMEVIRSMAMIEQGYGAISKYA